MKTDGWTDERKAAFNAVWLNRGKKFAVRQVKYKRRYWNGSAFVYETNWQTLRMKDFSQIGTLTQQLDTVKKNEFKVSNLTLSLNNRDGRWFPDCTTSVFAADPVATSGYQPYKTLFQILAGYELEDGTEELLTLFTGLLVDYNLSSTSDHIEYIIIGYEEKLMKADAQMVSTAFTDEALTPAPNGTNRDFYTTSLGVGRVSRVRIDGVVKSEGTHYTLSQLNEYGEGAKITFEVAPGASTSLDASGRKWDTLSKIETLIGKLCDQAGIGSGTTERQIDSVLFPNGVNAYQRINDTAGWEAGSMLQNISTAEYPNSINPTWKAGASLGSGVVQSGRVLATMGIVGTPGYGQASVLAAYDTNYYWLIYSAGQGALRFAITNRATPFSVVTDLGAVCPFPGTGEHEYRVQRNAASNEWRVWVDNDLKLTVTSSTGSPTMFVTGGTSYVDGSGNGMSISANSPFCSPNLVGSYNNANAVTVYESEEFDLLAVPTAWGTLDSLETLNGGTVTYATNVRTGSGAWDGWVDISPSKQIQSALKQKLKIRVTIAWGAGSSLPPIVSEVTANFTTTTIFVALANFTAMKVYDAIQKLAKLCNYEWGFEGDGQFFFRSKAASSTPALSIDQKDIQSVSSYKPGWPEVINAGQVSYGDSGQYYKEYNSDSLPETAPTSKDIYGESIQSDNAADFLLAFDADLATGAAQIIHDDNYRARRKIKLICRLIPHLDISDTISATFIQDPLKKDYVFGDPLQKWGVGSIPDSAILLNNKKLKVTSHVQRFADQISELTTEGIL